MRNTTMTLQRNKVTIRTGIPVMVENMAWKVAEELGGQSPYDSFWIYLTGGVAVDIRRSDLLIDENQSDPLTSLKTRYRVFGNTEQFDGGYAEIPGEKLVGV